MLAAHIPHGVAYLVHYAELYGSVGEHAADGIREALEPVDTAYHDVLNATVLQVCKHLQPEVRALALRNIHAEQVFATLLVNTQDVVYRPRLWL